MSTATLRAVGRYRLETLIGRGGMAEVYRAVDSRLDRPVAVKMILPGLVARPEVLSRFLLEARLVAALEHPNILPIYDFGEADGVPFLVMPLMTGGTLAERIGSSGLPPQVVADWIAQVAEALDTAHAAGILHRDVKPGNVLMDRKERPVLADFGLARSLNATSDLTRAGMLVGTPLFMAPELAQGAKASAGSDLYALGVLAYQMLSGTTPFDAETPVAVLHQHVAREVPAISHRIDGLPERIDGFFSRALAKDPDRRFASGAELARDFAERLGIAPIADRSSGAAPVSDEARAESASAALLEGAVGVTSVPDLRPAPVVAAPARVVSHRRWTAVFVVLFAALGVLLGARSLLGRHPSRPDGAAVAPAVAPDPGRGPESSAAGPSPAGAAHETAETRAAAPRWFQGLRRPRRLAASDFQALARRADARLASRPDDPHAIALAAFADGGLAWAKGDEPGAREAIASIEPSPAVAEIAGGLPAWIAGIGSPGVRAAWELAVLYGDARGDGLALVAARLERDPGDVRAQMGRALLLHFGGRHAEAVATAHAAHPDLTRHDTEAAGQVLRFLGDERSELGQWHEALEAYRGAVRLGGSVVAQAGIDGGRVALEQLGDTDAARELFGRACGAGSDLACRRAAALDAERERRFPRSTARRTIREARQTH